jgi:hypothetical protein
VIAENKDIPDYDFEASPSAIGRISVVKKHFAGNLGDAMFVTTGTEGDARAEFQAS